MIATRRSIGIDSLKLHFPLVVEWIFWILVHGMAWLVYCGPFIPLNCLY